MPRERGHLVIVWGLAIALAACSNEGPTNPQGAGEAVSQRPSANQSASEDPFAEGTGRRAYVPTSKIAPRRTRSQRRPSPTAEVAVPIRDWAAELRSAASPIDSCAPPETELPTQLRLRLEATISATGRVTRAYVTGSTSPLGLNRCLRERLLAASFSPPEDAAPHTVRTELVAERRDLPAAPGE